MSVSSEQIEEVQIDQKLMQWTSGLGLHPSAQRIFLSQGYTLDEILFHVSRDDIRRIGLKGGSEFRIWKAIRQYRMNTGPLCNGTISEDGGTT